MSHTFNYIDLGLPSGTLWATCNIGANSSTAAGFYFSDLMFYPLSDTSLINVIETLPAPKAKEIPSIRLATLSEVWEQVGTRLLGIPTDEQVKELLTECVNSNFVSADFGKISFSSFRKLRFSRFQKTLLS